MSWDGGMMSGGGLTDDDVYAAMAAATAHSQAAAEVHRVSYISASAALVQALFDDGCAQFAAPRPPHRDVRAVDRDRLTGSKASASSAGAVGLRVPSVTAFMMAKFSQGGVEPCSPCSQ